jgi:hypothetical protein
MAKDKSRGKDKGKAKAKKKAQPETKTTPAIKTPVKVHNLPTPPKGAESVQPASDTPEATPTGPTDVPSRQ